MNNYKTKAFFSCSLRLEDRAFNDHVERILRNFGVLPFGTIGRFNSYTENPTVSMKRNIEQSDFVVVAATKRYLTEDIHNTNKSSSISEMIQAEIAMGHALNKPIVAFVEKGTDAGNFLSSITQYIILDGTIENFKQQYQIIYSLLNDAYQKAMLVKKKKDTKEIKNLLISSLAIYGGLKLFENKDYD